MNELESSNIALLDFKERNCARLQFIHTFIGRAYSASHVTSPQHLSDGFIELFSAADFFEAGEEVFGAKAAFLGAAEVMNDPAAVHHDEAVAETGRLLHRVCDHKIGRASCR